MNAKEALLEIERIKTDIALTPEERIQEYFSLHSYADDSSHTVFWFTYRLFAFVSLIGALFSYVYSIESFGYPLFINFIATFIVALFLMKKHQKNDQLDLIFGKQRNYGILNEEILIQCSKTGEGLEMISRFMGRPESALKTKLKSLGIYEEYQENFYKKYESQMISISKNHSRSPSEQFQQAVLDKKEWHNNLKALIKHGESKKVEYKQSFDTCIETGGTKVSMRNGIWKTIDAFLNTAGGWIFIGVKDEEPYAIEGLVHDPHRSDDKWVIHLNNKINNVFKVYVHEFIDIFVEKIDGKRIIAIQVRKASKITPVRLEKGDPDLKDNLKNIDLYFKRTGTETIRLESTDLITHKDELFS